MLLAIAPSIYLSEALQLARLGWQVPRRVVPAGHAIPHRAHEEDRPLAASAPRADPQLFPGSKTALQRRRRGSEQQSQSHYEKILWLPNLPNAGTRPLSLTWQAAGARIVQKLERIENNPTGRLVAMPHDTVEPWAFSIRSGPC